MTETEEAWYDIAISAQILGFAEEDNHPDHVAIKFLDPDTMETVVDIRYTDLANLRDHLGVYQLALAWLEETQASGAESAMNKFSLEKIEYPQGDDFSVQDILDAGPSDE